MNIKHIVRAAAFSTTAILSAGVAESAGHDQSPNSVENFMRSIDDPNVKPFGKSNLLYDGEKLVVVGSQCGPAAVRVFLNQKGNDLVALFGAYSSIPRDVSVKPVNVNSVAAHALIDDGSKTFTNDHAVGAKWYDGNGPLPDTTDEAQLALANSQSCGGSGGTTQHVIVTPGEPGTPPGTEVTPTPGCNGSATCGGGSHNNGGSHGDDNGGGTHTTGPNENGGNTPPGYGDAQHGDASSIVTRAVNRVSAPSLSMA